MGIRNLTLDGIDADAWDVAKTASVKWIGSKVSEVKTSGQFDSAATAITRVGLRTVAVRNGEGTAESETSYLIESAAADIDLCLRKVGVFSAMDCTWTTGVPTRIAMVQQWWKQLWFRGISPTSTNSDSGSSKVRFPVLQTREENLQAE
jgi:hypothetical protein